MAKDTRFHAKAGGGTYRGGYAATPVKPSVPNEEPPKAGGMWIGSMRVRTKDDTLEMYWRFRVVQSTDRENGNRPCPFLVVEKVWRPRKWPKRPSHEAPWYAIPLTNRGYSSAMIPGYMMQGLAVLIVETLAKNRSLGYDPDIIQGLVHRRPGSASTQNREQERLLEDAERLYRGATNGLGAHEGLGGVEDRAQPESDRTGMASNRPEDRRDS